MFTVVHLAGILYFYIDLFGAVQMFCEWLCHLVYMEAYCIMCLYVQGELFIQEDLEKA